MNPILQVSLPLRAKIVRALRETLDAQDFVEVETPVRIPAPANEPHIRPPASGNAFLRASPELQMKQLLSNGFSRIYQLGPCFREGERGSRHAPEFTMLEWYRAPSDYREILEDLKTLVRTAARVLHPGSAAIEFRGVSIDLDEPWLELTVRQAFLRYAGWDPLAEWDPLRFDEDMALQVEPALPKNRPVVLLDYPKEAASLSRLSSRDPRVAERWEVYIGGMELANAFSELTDPEEQRRRFIAAQEEKQVCGEPVMPLDEDFLRSLSQMPPAGGAALGVDRLCMVLLGLEDIEMVRPFLPAIGALY